RLLGLDRDPPPGSSSARSATLPPGSSSARSATLPPGSSSARSATLPPGSSSARSATLPPGWERTSDGELVPPSGFDAGDAGNGWRYAVRCGLQDVRGITAAEIESILDNRPFPSLEDVRVRANL